MNHATLSFTTFCDRVGCHGRSMLFIVTDYWLSDLSVSSVSLYCGKLQTQANDDVVHFTK